MYINLETTYQASLSAFDQGDFPKARLLASQCIAAAPQGSYYHLGALGLKCWAANYLGDNATVKREAALLLNWEANIDKRWFEAIALYNLGIVHHRMRKSAQAKDFFIQASRSYSAYQNDSNQPYNRIFINKFYAAITYWASTGDRKPLEELQRTLLDYPAPDREIEGLISTVGLYLRRTKGDDVMEEAEIAALQGVSRVYLAYLLLEKKQPFIL